MQVFAEDEGDFAFGPWLDQVIAGQADIAAILDLHGIGEEAEVRLVDVEHFLHGTAGDSDFLADHLLAEGFAALQEVQGNPVGLLQGDLRITAGQGGQRLPATQGVEQLVTERVDQMGVHGEGSSGVEEKRPAPTSSGANPKEWVSRARPTSRHRHRHQ
ncbi:hypothetical protein D9M73_180260 [compost metagenome]